MSSVPSESMEIPLKRFAPKQLQGKHLRVQSYSYVTSYKMELFS